MPCTYTHPNQNRDPIGHVHPVQVIKGPKGPEPALGFFEKNPRIVPKIWSPTSRDMSRSKQNNNNKVFAQRARGSRERFFRFTLLLLRQRSFNVTFSSTLRRLRYRSGRKVFVYVALP
jgi:hypothetical protein